MLLLRSIVLAAFVTQVYGQSTEPVTLTLPQAVSMAIKNHPQLASAQATYLRSDQLIREQQANYYPSINGEITGSQANQDARIGAGYLTDSRLFNRLGYGVSISQLISDFGRTSSLVASSKLDARASRKDYEATKDDVVLGVQQAYYEVLLAQSLVDVAEQTVQMRQTAVEQISELTKNKLRSQLDLNLTEVNLASAKVMLLRARNNLNGAYATLSQALGSQNMVEYKLVTSELPGAPPADAAPLVSESMRHRPELASLRLREESNKKTYEAERDLKRPTVSLSAVAGFLPLISPGNANPNIAKEYEGAAVNVQIPVFNGHLFSARAGAAELEVQVTREKRRDLENRIARDVRAAWARTQTVYQTIDATRQMMQQANSALDLAQERYKLGLSSVVELTQAELAQTQAQVENLNAQYEYQEAYASLEYAQGLLH